MAVMMRERTLVTGGNPEATYPVPEQTTFMDPLTHDELDYRPADDLETIAQELILRHDDTLRACQELRIIYRWKRDGGEKAGKPTYGACVKANPLLEHLAAVDVVIWLAADHLAGASAYTIEAVLFHELCHVGVSDKAKPRLHGHDLEEFRAVVAAYGIDWRADLKQMAAAMQLSLPID